jgi:glycosyltransferase involved in cell wall biosynthesis
VQNLPVPFDRRVWLEATSLTRAGHTVSVICPKLKGYVRSFERLEGVDVYRYPAPVQGEGALTFAVEMIAAFLWTTLLSMRIRLFGRGFDVIHACNPPDTFWLLARVWRLAGVRFVYDQHDLCPEMFFAKFGRRGFLHRMLLRLECFSFQSADVVIAPNRSHAEIARARGGVEPERIAIVRSGPDPDRLRPGPPDDMLKRGRRFLCTYLGEMCPQDGVDHLVRAAKILCVDRGRHDVLFAFLGGGPSQPALVAYARELGVDAHCDFAGHVSDADLSRYLSTTDLGVDPTPRTEWSDRSTMNKIGEYMYFGCPVVAFDLRESRYTAGAAACFVASDRDEDLADQIERLLDDEPTRHRMRDMALHRARTELVWAQSEPELLAAYARLEPHRTQPDPAADVRLAAVDP